VATTRAVPIWQEPVRGGYADPSVLGFTEEGRLREHFERDGRRHDVILMGLLRSEWEPAG
jgi:hypothetical protein